jgi:hypothetical protein
MQVKKNFPGGPPHLDPIKNMGIKDERFLKLVKASLLPQEACHVADHITAFAENHSVGGEVELSANSLAAGFASSLRRVL